MASVVEIRGRLCKCIASLDVKASLEDVSKVLDPVLNSQKSTTNEASVDDDGVTPLMLACDRDNLACIEWILKRISEDSSLIPVLGGPLDRAESGNTAMHYIAYSGNSGALPLLRDMMKSEDTNPMMKLASLRNENFDTPIMIAAVKGHVVFLQQIIFLLESGDGENAKKLFELVNNDGNTALSLAYGHGNVDVVNFLLQEASVEVIYDNVKEAEQTLKQIDWALKLSGASLPEEHKIRRNNVHRCLVIIKLALAKLSQANMEQLLAEEDEEKERRQGADTMKKRKPRRRKGTKSVMPNVDKTSVSHTPTEANSSSDDESDTIEIGRAGTNATDDRDLNNKQAESTLPSFEHQEVVKVATTGSTATPRIIPAEPVKRECNTELDVDAIIEALCLDPSMLLLNPREMAMDLSPCQLDAVAAVLRNQMLAVKEARSIQSCQRDQPSRSQHQSKRADFC